MVSGTLPGVESHLALLDQGLALLDRLDDETFRGSNPHAPGGTIGAHFRHVLDFYACLVEALEGGAPRGTVDYTRRVRGTESETDRAAATARFREIRTRLGRVADRPADAVLSVTAEVEDGAGGASAPSRSSLGRELSFLASHTVHHFALIAFLVRSTGGSVPDAFGVAPSTLRHWEESRGGAPCASER